MDVFLCRCVHEKEGILFHVSPLSRIPSLLLTWRSSGQRSPCCDSRESIDIFCMKFTYERLACGYQKPPVELPSVLDPAPKRAYHVHWRLIEPLCCSWTGPFSSVPGRHTCGVIAFNVMYYLGLANLSQQSIHNTQVSTSNAQRKQGTRGLYYILVFSAVQACLLARACSGS
jgi:hypothetical protein